ncbi:MAG: putative transposase [Gammaproteobacteria bacterium]|jgi:putative transposase
MIQNCYKGIVMPRKSRIVLSGQPVHIIQRGNNRSATFYSGNDHRYYLEFLAQASEECQCAIHAYVLMTNHVHILATPKNETGVSRLMQSVGRRYVRHINKTYQRTGTLWEGRFKHSLIQDEFYYLNCSKYIELNPVRACMVESPESYLWSSYRHNALGQINSIIQPHDLYLRLGQTIEERAQHYQALFNNHIEHDTVTAIRKAINKDQILGNDKFKEEIEQILKRNINTYEHGEDRKSKTFKHTQR